MPRVLSLCDRTGNIVLPWAEAGYECVCVDLQHPYNRTTPGPHPNITFLGADVKHWLAYDFDQCHARYHATFAAPPCTDMAVSGARWFKSKGLDAIIEALRIVNACRKTCESSTGNTGRWMLENPVSTLATYWRKPDYTFNPCDYGAYLDPAGDAYTKKTCLWVGGGFVMPDPRPVEPVEGSRMHLLPPSDDRGDKRSETPLGFARAVFEANKL